MLFRIRRLEEALLEKSTRDVPRSNVSQLPGTSVGLGVLRDASVSQSQEQVGRASGSSESSLKRLAHKCIYIYSFIAIYCSLRYTIQHALCIPFIDRRNKHGLSACKCSKLSRAGKTTPSIVASKGTIRSFCRCPAANIWRSPHSLI